VYGHGDQACQGRAEAGARGRRRYISATCGPGRRSAENDTAWRCLMYAILNLLNTVISVYIWLLIASVVLSWLIAFNVVSTGNGFVYSVRDFLYRITEPLLRPIRNLLPNLGGIDISPVILILALYFVRDLAFELLLP
jgi:YggT family protein